MMLGTVVFVMQKFVLLSRVIENDFDAPLLTVHLVKYAVLAELT